MFLPHPARLLDPRSETAARANPIADSANIPMEELPDRLGELPSRSLPVLIADVEGAAEAKAFLEAGGREALLETPTPKEAFVAGRLWEPSSWLTSLDLKPKPGARALDLGCGHGRDAVYLASLGYEVLAVEKLKTAAESATNLAARYQASVRVVCRDWFSSSLDEGPFALALSLMAFHRDLHEVVSKRLQPGGLWLVQAFSYANHVNQGRPRDPVLTIDPSNPTCFGELAIEEVAEFVEGDRILVRAKLRQSA